MTYDVTIGIPVYKAKDYIDKTLESALGQTHPSIEFLIVDDCGEDGSMAIVQRYKKKSLRGKDLRIIKNDRNFGVSYSRNRIIDEAQGKYLFFLDSDDVIEPNTIQLLYNTILYHQVEVVYGSYEIINIVDGAPTEVYKKDSIVLTKNGDFAAYVYKNSRRFHVSVCNCLIELAFLRQTDVRFIDTQYWEDFAFTYEFAPNVKRAVLLSDITYHYYRREGSLSHYQVRDSIEKKEICNNVSTIKYLKEKCEKYRGEDYLPYLCYNLEINSFYVVCHILKNRHRIRPGFSFTEMREMLAYPLCIGDVIQFRHKFLSNTFLFLLSIMPVFVFIPAIWVVAKVKKAI